MKLNTDKNRVKEVRDELKLDKHCPCMVVQNEDTLCPCKPCREEGICICLLYMRAETKEEQ